MSSVHFLIDQTQTQTQTHAIVVASVAIIIISRREETTGHRHGLLAKGKIARFTEERKNSTASVTD